MKLSQIARLAQHTALCKLWKAGPHRTQYIETEQAVYILDNIPQIESEAQLYTILGIPEKKWVKLHTDNVYSNDPEMLGSVNIASVDESDVALIRHPLSRIGAYSLFYNKESKGIIFLDEANLAPLAVELRSMDSSISLRKLKDEDGELTGEEIVIVKNGMYFLAAIWPESVISEELMQNLSDVETRCVDEFTRKCSMEEG